MPLTSVLGTQARVWHGVYDLSDYLAGVDEGNAPPALDITTFGHTNVVEVPGGSTATTLDFSGFLSVGAGEIDAVLRAALTGQTQVAFTLSRGGNSIGARAAVGKVRQGDYNLTAAAGEVWALDGNFAVPTGLLGGYLLKALGATSGAGTTFSTAVDYGAQTTGGYAATLHVTAASGTGSPSLIVTVQTCTTQAGVYVDAFSFTTVSGTTPTSEYKTATGVTLDRWRRVKMVLAGTSPVYTFGVGLASRT